MLNRIVLYLRMIKFSHSVFALPFAFTAAVLASRGVPDLHTILWITVAMVSGRSAAMGLNRVIDREIDAKNPRTSQREIPSGKIKITEAWLFIIVSLGVFVYSAYRLNPLCLKLSPVAIAFFVVYPFTKRFTWLCHLVLGIAIAGAPLGAWIAVKGEISMEIFFLVLAVVFWLAGFDTLYALQDVEFDKGYGIYSIPQKFGIKKAIYISRVFHLLTWLLLLVTALVFKLGIIFYIGLGIVGALLFYEHRLVREDDLSKLDMAFFNMNGYISLTVFFFTFADLLI
ncbi:MAG: UbiA family prenyltransferase [Nitrospirae bacterium]|nr:UbiA family prenyltransferase [Nitrospirota bacterium]